MPIIGRRHPGEQLFIQSHLCKVTINTSMPIRSLQPCKKSPSMSMQFVQTWTGQAFYTALNWSVTEQRRALSAFMVHSPLQQQWHHQRFKHHWYPHFSGDRSCKCHWQQYQHDCVQQWWQYNRQRLIRADHQEWKWHDNRKQHDWEPVFDSRQSLYLHQWKKPAVYRNINRHWLLFITHHPSIRLENKSDHPQ